MYHITWLDFNERQLTCYTRCVCFIQINSRTTGQRFLKPKWLFNALKCIMYQALLEIVSRGSFSSKSSFCIIYKASCINNLRHVSMQQKNIKENHHSVSKKATWCIIAKMHHFFIKIFSKKIPIVFCGQARPTAARHTPIHLYGRRDTLKMYQSWICVSDITFMYMYLLQRSLNVSKSCITYRSFHVLF